MAPRWSGDCGCLLWCHGVGASEGARLLLQLEAEGPGGQAGLGIAGEGALGWVAQVVHKVDDAAGEVRGEC